MRLQTVNASASPEVQMNENFDAVDAAALFGRKATTTTGLTWGYYGGYLNIAGTPTAISDGTVVLTASNTNYIVTERATGTVSASTTNTNWDSTDYIRLYSVVVGVSTITSYTDNRSLLNASAGDTVTTEGALINGATEKTTPDDADMVGLMDSAASNVLKKLSWANIKATLKTYFDSLTTTLTNKRITARRGSTASSATPTINTDLYDIYSLTAQAVDITSFTTNLSGTPVHGDVLLIEITGTAARAITWGASFEASTVALPSTTITTNMLTAGFIWNTATSKWRCVASA